MAMKKGTFYAVGVGPGDPELLTQKALRILQGCAVIAAPRGKGGAMTALSIAARAVDLSQKTIVPLPLAMERGAAARRMCHEEAAAVLAAHLDAGRDTAMVCLGDTSVYASSSYFLALLRERGYAVKQIPGVPSFCAAAAALGRSLTEMDAPLHIVPAGTTDLEEALAWPGSKVLMRGVWTGTADAAGQRAGRPGGSGGQLRSAGGNAVRHAALRTCAQRLFHHVSGAGRRR